MSRRMGSVTNTSERVVSVKTHWYTPASDSANVKERVVFRLPTVVPARLVGVVLAGIPSFNHTTVGVVVLMVLAFTWPTIYLIVTLSPFRYPARFKWKKLLFAVPVSGWSDPLVEGDPAKDST